MDNIMLNANYLISKYQAAVAANERNVLESYTLDAEETAGYWLYWARHETRKEFTDMLRNNHILLSENAFYAKVNELLKDCGR